jgi:hypothetical protein
MRRQCVAALRSGAARLGVISVTLVIACASPLSAQSPDPGAPATKPSIPIVNRANEVLPSWLRVRGEFRERFEGFSNSGFIADRDDVYWLSRLRLNATVTPARQVAFSVQVQDARVGDKEVGATTAPFRAPFDLREAYAEIRPSQAAVSARLGRQELAFGEQRLVGHLNWLNTARTFDGARVTLRRRSFTVDGFATSVVRILDDQFDKSGNGNRFVGAYGTLPKVIPKSSVEPYVFYRADRHLPTEAGTLGTLGVTTTGARWVGALPARLDYGIELAAQTGGLGSDSARAWAGHWQLRHAAGTTWAVRITGEYNYASGDENPTDGRRGTFDQLYPTGHDKLGLGDQIGWRNIRHMRAGVELLPAKKLPLTVNYHSWWLAETTDALYSASGAVLARVAGAAAASHVGQEIDIQAARAVTPQIQLAAGYAYLLPGAFLKEATPGKSYAAPYVMLTYILLADK